MIPFLSAVNWDVSPVIFQVGPVVLRWYALLFGSGLMIFGPLIVWRIFKQEQLPEAWFEKLFWYVVIATIVGARLGHVLFYDPAYYMAHPVEIFQTWKGGFASHGGTIGLIIAMWIYSRKVSKKPVLWIMDRLAVPIGLVAAMIRLGNLMNSEIFGRPTTLPWAFRFVRSQEYLDLNTTLGCHPTAIYEALAYLLVFAVCVVLYRKGFARRYQGVIVGALLALVFIARLIIEQIKIVQEPWELQLISSIGLNMGQLLSVPFIIAGIWIFVYALKHPVPQENITAKAASGHSSEKKKK